MTDEGKARKELIIKALFKDTVYTQMLMELYISGECHKPSLCRLQMWKIMSCSNNILLCACTDIQTRFSKPLKLPILYYFAYAYLVVGVSGARFQTNPTPLWCDRGSTNASPKRFEHLH